MQPLFEHRLHAGGSRTRALELEGDGPGVLLLHGWGDSADTWRPLLAELGARDRRALAVDLPGFGEASRLQPGPMLPQLDAFVAELVRDWGEGEPVVVAGNSLGGAVALRAAQGSDLPLEAVMPLAPAGLEAPRWFELVEHDPILRRLLALPMPVPGALVRSVVGNVYRQLAFSSRAVAQRQVVETFAGHHGTRARVAELLASGRRLIGELADGPFALDAIECPVLLVWGTRDRMVPHSGARVVLDALPDVRVELLDGCGHCPQLECTGRVLELLFELSPSRPGRRPRAII
jgi:pimeloyl-ACP methyl ester carboxylesterase